MTWIKIYLCMYYSQAYTHGYIHNRIPLVYRRIYEDNHRYSRDIRFFRISAWVHPPKLDNLDVRRILYSKECKCFCRNRIEFWDRI